MKKHLFALLVISFIILNQSILSQLPPKRLVEITMENGDTHKGYIDYFIEIGAKKLVLCETSTTNKKGKCANQSKIKSKDIKFFTVLKYPELKTTDSTVAIVDTMYKMYAYASASNKKIKKKPLFAWKEIKGDLTLYRVCGKETFSSSKQNMNGSWTNYGGGYNIFVRYYFKKESEDAMSFIANECDSERVNMKTYGHRIKKKEKRKFIKNAKSYFKLNEVIYSKIVGGSYDYCDILNIAIDYNKLSSK